MDLGINLAAIIVVAYLLLMLFIDAIGLIKPGLDEFHVASRSLKLVLLTGTFCATIVGASATLGMAGLGFSKGLPGAWWMLSGTVGLIVLSALFAGKIRATGCYTLPELVGSFYGDKARTAASILIAISWLGVIAVQIVASGKVLVALLGGNEIFYMAVCTAVFVLYTLHGGQVSVVKTDLVQFLIIIVGIVILFSKSLNAVGPSALISQSFPTSAQMGIWDVTSMLIVVGSVYLVGPDMYSRLFSAQSPEIAKKSAIISAFILDSSCVSNNLIGYFREIHLPQYIARAGYTYAYDRAFVAIYGRNSSCGASCCLYVLCGYKPYDGYINLNIGYL